jgi:hypothetical protein
MHLYVPKNQPMPLDAKEDEHIMDLTDFLTLKEIMEQFKSFDQLASVVIGRHLKEKQELRYQLRFKDVPIGSPGETFRAVINIFGDIGSKTDGKMPALVPMTKVCALMAEEFSCSERVAKSRLVTLMHSGHLVQEHGCIKFPKEKLER